jgi:hypothetical protein
MITWGKPSHTVLCELENLDIAQMCARLCPDPEYHSACHEEFLHPIGFKWIVDWLWARRPPFAIPSVTNLSIFQSFPSPPQQTIEFWERQMVAVETCQQSLLQ